MKTVCGIRFLLALSLFFSPLNLFHAFCQLDAQGNGSISSRTNSLESTGENHQGSAVIGDDSQPPLAEWSRGADDSPIAVNAMFSAVLAADLNKVGSLQVAIPGYSGLSMELRGTVLGLAYIEPGEEGRSVVIAEVTSSAPEWLNSQQVMYANGLLGPGVVADVVYELTRYSVAQDVVIRGRIPEPRRYGLSSEAVLAVITEFYDAPEPFVSVPDAGGDVVLHWGRMGMVKGKAFSLGEEEGAGLAVQKHWTKMDGRTVLLEAVPYVQLKERLEALPVLDELPEPSEGEAADLQGALHSGKSIRDLLAKSGQTGGRLLTAAATSVRGKLARRPHRADVNSVGVVLDYVLTVPRPVINVDFGYSNSTKTGFAAVGQTSSDVWNFYDYSGQGTVTGLQWSDAYQWSGGHNSGASVTMTNVQGRWGFSTLIDAMYAGYLYQYQGAMGVTVSNLPAGYYDFYLYGHGPAQNADGVFTLGGTTLRTASTGDTWATADWTNGQQYVVFSSVYVSSSQPARINIGVGYSGYSEINGMQIVPTGQLASAPAITSQPQSQAVKAGANATFSVTATGTAPLSYQWRKDGSHISGATSSVYTRTNVQSSDAGSYSVAILNVAGTTFSDSASLTITIPPTITSQPQSVVTNLGGSATFSVSASGTAPLKFQWQLNGSNLYGATNWYFTTNNVQMGSAGNYRVVVTNSAGGVTSAVATLTIRPYITTQPQSRTVYVGSNVTFSVVAGGTTPLSYQWRFSSTNIAGATGTSYTINNAQLTNAGTYTVVISNLGGSLTSSNAVLGVLSGGDRDYDAIPAQVEEEQGTDPADPASVTKTPLGHWPLVNDTPTVSLQKSVSEAEQLGRIRLNEVGANGVANFNCREGTIRFWFSPVWNSVDEFLSPVSLVDVGSSWGLWATSDGVEFRSDGEALLKASVPWNPGQWYYVSLAYGPNESALYVDGALLETGPGVRTYPDESERAMAGLNVGNANARVRDLESFNYTQGSAEVFQACLADRDADGMPDGWELRHFGDLTRDDSSDSDGDGIPDAQESALGSNPLTSSATGIGIQIFGPQPTSLVP